VKPSNALYNARGQQVDKDGQDLLKNLNEIQQAIAKGD